MPSGNLPIKSGPATSLKGLRIAVSAVLRLWGCGSEMKSAELSLEGKSPIISIIRKKVRSSPSHESAKSKGMRECDQM